MQQTASGAGRWSSRYNAKVLVGSATCQERGTETTHTRPFLIRRVRGEEAAAHPRRSWPCRSVGGIDATGWTANTTNRMATSTGLETTVLGHPGASWASWAAGAARLIGTVGQQGASWGLMRLICRDEIFPKRPPKKPGKPAARTRLSARIQTLRLNGIVP